MKVLHIGKYFQPRYGGIETFMSNLMEEQASHGLDVSALIHADKLRSKEGNYNWKNCRIFEAKFVTKKIIETYQTNPPLNNLY